MPVSMAAGPQPPPLCCGWPVPPCRCSQQRAAAHALQKCFQHPLGIPGIPLQLIIFSHFASLPVRIFLWSTAALRNVSPPFPIVD